MEIVSKYLATKSGKYTHQFIICTHMNVAFKVQSSPYVPISIEIGLLFITFEYNLLKLQ